MSGWDIDEEEKHEKKELKEKPSGKEFYTFVVSYPGLRPKQFIPHKGVYDSKGNKVLSPYGNKKEQKTEECDRDGIERQKIIKWSTKKDVLDDMDPQCRTVCNSLKAYFTKSQVAIWYHNGQTDECSEFHGPHLHVITRSEETSSGKFRQLYAITTIKTLKKKCSEAGGYFRSQAVRKMEGLMYYLRQPPRVFMGTNSAVLNRKYRLEATEQPEETYQDCLEPDEDVTVDDGCEREWTGFEEDMPSTSKRPGDWSDDDMEVQPQKKQKVSHTVADGHVANLRRLMLYFDAYTVDEMFKKIAVAPQVGKYEKYKEVWKRMIAKRSTGYHMGNIKREIMAEWRSMSFTQMIRYYCENVEHDSAVYESPESSYEIFCEWCEDQKLKLPMVVADVFDLIDKKLSIGTGSSRCRFCIRYHHIFGESCSFRFSSSGRARVR